MSRIHPDGRRRCAWVPLNDELYLNYHDREWGRPVKADRTLFEFFILESAQAGLSWRTILGKREGYRLAFANFDPQQVALYTEADLESLSQNPAIIRHRPKLAAAVNNARVFLAIAAKHGSFHNYLWSWVNNTPVVNQLTPGSNMPSVTPLAVAIANDLKANGVKFFGPTITYSYLQAVGVVNDHETDCWSYKSLLKPLAE